MIEVRFVRDMQPVFDDLKDLHRAHWDETETYRGRHFSPAYELLRHYWNAGIVRMWGAFDGERLIGHATLYVTQSVHTGEMIATEDALYVLPEYRKGVGARLVDASVKGLAAEGIKEIWATCKPETRVGQLLERKGFAHVANTYFVRLNHVQP